MSSEETTVAPLMVDLTTEPVGQIEAVYFSTDRTTVTINFPPNFPVCGGWYHLISGDPDKRGR